MGAASIVLCGQTFSVVFFSIRSTGCQFFNGSSSYPPLRPDFKLKENYWRCWVKKSYSFRNAMILKHYRWDIWNCMTECEMIGDFWGGIFDVLAHMHPSSVFQHAMTVHDNWMNLLQVCVSQIQQPAKLNASRFEPTSPNLDLCREQHWNCGAANIEGPIPLVFQRNKELWLLGKTIEHWGRCRAINHTKLNNSKWTNQRTRGNKHFDVRFRLSRSVRLLPKYGRNTVYEERNGWKCEMTIFALKQHIESTFP